MGPDTTKPVFEFSDKVRFKPAWSATETSQNSKTSLVASLDMILSNKQITKVLIRLRRCAGWSAPLLFANLDVIHSHYICNTTMQTCHAYHFHIGLDLMHRLVCTFVVRNPKDRFSHIEAHIKMPSSKKSDKDQESIQSSTTPDPGYHSPYNRHQPISNFKHCILIVKITIIAGKLAPNFIFFEIILQLYCIVRSPY